jgi:hypothetical protein
VAADVVQEPDLGLVGGAVMPDDVTADGRMFNKIVPIEVTGSDDAPTRSVKSNDEF